MPPASRAVPAAADGVLRLLLGGPLLPARVVVATGSVAYAQLAASTRALADHEIQQDLDPPALDGPLLVAVLTPPAARLPAGLLPAARAAELVARLRPGDEVVLGGGAADLGVARLVPARWWDSRVPGIALGDAPASAAHPDLPPLPDVVRPAAQALEPALTGSDALEPLRHVAAGLVGLGPGLTPAGDDVLAGALVALTAAGDRPRRDRLAAAVRPLLPRTTLVSAALLEHAAAGRAVLELGRFVAALASGRVVGGVVQDLLRVGASSGVALAWGALIGLRAAASGPVPTGREVT